MNTEEKAKAYNEALKQMKECIPDENGFITIYPDEIFPELKESKDEQSKKWILEYLYNGLRKSDEQFKSQFKSAIAWLEKQGEQNPQGKPALEVWKDMRLEVYQQASGNRHEPNYSDDSTKMFSLTDIDEIFEKVAEKQGEQKLFNNDKYQTVSVKILDRLYESEKELERLKQGEQKPTLPKWKYKNDSTPLLRDSLILNKYGCVSKSPSGAIVSDVWVIDYDELAKLPKEESEKQVEQKPADKVEPKFHIGDEIRFFGKGTANGGITDYYKD